VVSAGKAAVAMILNGLGFTNRRLYLTPQFFESKPPDFVTFSNFQHQSSQYLSGFFVGFFKI
jgi:hypothetical protein